MKILRRAPWLLILEILALSLAWWIVAVLRARTPPGALPPLPERILLPIGLFIVPAWIGARSYARARGLGATSAVAVALAASLALLWLAHVPVNRSALLAFAALSLPIAIAFDRARERLRERRRVWLVGADAAIEPLVRHLSRLGAPPVGRTDPDRAGALSDEIAPHAVDEILVAGLLPFETLSEIAKVAEARGVPLSLDASFVGLRAQSASLVEIGGWTTIAVRPASERDIEHILKRALDIAGALIGLSVAAPLLIALIALIRAVDGEPALLKQTRVGRYGRPFELYKLRTMIPEQDSPTGGGWRPEGGYKPSDDPRVTRIGRWLRRSSLDELPQLLNVLKGEMSLVGPRPPLPSEAARYERWQWRRLSVRPGMTGLWQVSGRADLPYEAWVPLDLQYIDQFSLWLDLSLLLRTLPVVLRGTGAR